MRQIALLLLFLSFGSTALAQSAGHTCTNHAGVGYCTYTGKVSTAYVNAQGLLLLYYETPLTQSILSGATQYVGTVTEFDAAAYPYNDDPEFAKMLYSTLLTAKTTGATIRVQMRGTSNPTTGYPLIDRIWMY